ncbi:MAG: hypothetical protein RL637_1562, partial [Pseudomonadota bacterium]
MLSIALTGGIACGKSTVCELFSRQQIAVIDADIIARQLVGKNQPGLLLLVQLFGKDILQQNGELNRSYLRQLIFSDSNKKQQTEAILHPLIYAEIDKQLITIKSSYCIVAIPLLIETRQTKRFNRILVVDCPIDLQKKRLIQRDQRSDINQLEAIINSQIQREQRLKYADDVIDNSTDLLMLEQQVKHLHFF